LSRERPVTLEEELLLIGFLITCMLGCCVLAVFLVILAYIGGMS
jgi:hypothetical protein